jgi:predicted ester cyclase
MAINKTIVRRLYDFINGNQTDDLASIIPPTYIDHSNGSKGPGGVAAAMANLHRAYADLKIELFEMVSERDFVVVRWIETGRHVEQFFNLKPTGKAFEARGINIYRVEADQIVESWLGIDPSTIRAQQAAQQALAASAD